MLMILAILVAAIYFTLLNFSSLKKLAGAMRWLLYVLLLVYLCDGIYFSVRHFHSEKLMDSLIPAVCIALLVEGMRYSFKKRSGREKN